MAYDIIFSNSWVVMSFSQKNYSQKTNENNLLKKNFGFKQLFQITVQPNNNLTVLTIPSKSSFYEKVHATKHL